MNHVDDIAKKVRDALNADPDVYRVTLALGEPRGSDADYPIRDGEWIAYVAMRDLRYFRLTFKVDEQVRELAMLADAEEGRVHADAEIERLRW